MTFQPSLPQGNFEGMGQLSGGHGDGFGGHGPDGWLRRGRFQAGAAQADLSGLDSDTCIFM